MDTKDLRGLMEAYSEVYAPQEVDEATAMAKRGYDEAPIRQKIAKSTGGGEAADRATKLAQNTSFRGPESQRARNNLARKQRGDFRKTTSSSPGLRGYAHKSDDPKVKEKQVARSAQRNALTPNERKQLNMGDESFDLFDTILEFLCVEGFAETLEEAEWMMANIINEEAIAMVSASKEEFASWLDEAMTNYEKNRKRAAMRAAMRNDARAQGKTGAVPGVGYVTPRKERETWTDESGKTRHARGL